VAGLIVVDASCLYEVVTNTDRGHAIGQRLLDADLVAPHVIDVEVLGTLRRNEALGLLDSTEARQAVEDLQDWPGTRFDHRPFIARAWELRQNVRTWDALYVALAEALDAPLLTSDERLSRASGPRCEFRVITI
jgi:predicted nucleic acid-binding protein